jgi:hypothetical protein
MKTALNLARFERAIDGGSILFLVLGMILAAAVFSLGS